MIALLLVVATLFVPQRPGALQPGSGIVTGIIKVEGGASAANIRVGAVPIDDPTASSFLAVTETDSSGRFRLTNIPAGRYYIVAGRLTNLRFFPGGATAAEAAEIAVEPARIRADVNFTVGGNSARPQTASRPGQPDRESTAYDVASREPNPDRKMKLLLDFEKAFPNSPLAPRVYADLMNVYVTRGDARTAQSYGEKLLARSPHDVSTFLQISRNYTLLQIDPKKALEYAEKALALALRMKTEPPPSRMGQTVSIRYAASLETGARSNLDWVKKTNAWHQKQFLSLVTPRRAK